MILMLFSCSREGVTISKSEYLQHEEEGFWSYKTNKVLKYNKKKYRPKVDRQVKKLNRDNQRILKQNNKYAKNHRYNSEYLKTFDHH